MLCQLSYDGKMERSRLELNQRPTALQAITKVFGPQQWTRG